MENDVIFERPIKGPSTKVLTRVVTKKRLGWASIGLSVLAFGTAIAAAGALTWYVTEGQIVSKQQAKEIKVVLKANDKDIQNKINFVPEQDEAKLQSSLNALGGISTVSKDLNKETTTFTDFFLAGSKMFGKGIANVNTKVESLWENFIDKHFGKVEKDALGVVQTTPLASKIMDGDKVAKTALDTLTDTTGALDIKSDLYVGTNAQPKDLYVTGKTTTAGTSAFTGNVEIGSKTRSTTLKIFSDTTIGTDTNKKNLTINGNTILGSLATSTLEVKATSTFDESITANKDLTVTGTTTLEGTKIGVDKTGTTTTLKVYGDTTIGSTTNKKTLTVNGVTDLNGNTNIGSSNHKSTTLMLGLINMGKPIIFDYNTNLVLHVKGASTLDGDVVIGELDSKSQTIQRNYTAKIYADTTIGASGIDAKNKKNLTVYGNATINGITKLGEQNASLTNLNLQVLGKSRLDGNVDIGLISNANTLLNVYSNTIIGTSNKENSLIVNGTTVLKGDLTINKNLSIIGLTSLNGDTIIGFKSTNTLNVNGPTTLNSSLSIGSDLTLKGGLKGFSFKREIKQSEYGANSTVPLLLDKRFKDGINVLYTFIVTYKGVEYTFFKIGTIDSKKDFVIKGSFVNFSRVSSSGNPSGSVERTILFAIEVTIHNATQVTKPKITINVLNGFGKPFDMPQYGTLLIRKI